MAVDIITSFSQQCDSAGNPISGCKIYVYNVGTTTPRDVYSDPDLDISHVAANPIVCDSAGRHAMRYTATGSYKIVVKTSADVTVYTNDNIDGRVPIGSGALAIANGGTGATSANAAIAALGGATSAEVADIAADVASVVGSLASTEKTHIATGSTAQRPAAGTEGDFRRNTSTSRWEGYNNSAAWENFLTQTEVASASDATTGTSTTKWMNPATVRAANAFQSALLHVRDQQTANTDGGTFTSGAWRTRVLNTSVTNEITGASLGSNQITLPSGTYYIEASAPGNSCAQHVAKLKNVTDATDTIIGTVEQATTSVQQSCRSMIRGRFTIAAQKVFEIQHQCVTTKATVGLGAAANLGVVEVYADCQIWKVA